MRSVVNSIFTKIINAFFYQKMLKSRFCSSCGKVAVDRWVETSLSQILDVKYKHLVFTLPEEFRDWFRNNRKVCLSSTLVIISHGLEGDTQAHRHGKGGEADGMGCPGMELPLL